MTAMLGRRNTARLARLLGNEARLDRVNDQHENGERMVQATVLEHAAPSGALVVFDVGANVGDWTAMLIDEAAVHRRQAIDVYAFEPAARTFQSLSSRLGNERRARVELVKRALSDAPGELTLHVPGGGAGTSSLHGLSLEVESQSEQVAVTTLDAFCSERQINNIDLLKVDTEGHDLVVLEGARDLLARRAIDVIQLEYNHRWVFARKLLRDVFDLLSPLGYEIGKVTPLGVERYTAWHPELESYREGNYLAFQPQWSTRFPAIRWWNDTPSSVGSHT
jgi:FkbM family methyltransferase